VSALNSGSVDAFLVGGPDAEEYAKQFSSLHIAASQPVDHATTVAFQKDNTALVDAYNAQLEAMVKDGTYKKIYEKYFTEAPAPQLLQIWPGLA
jgi:polar amino acid transport system substrate-binding protein